jgi:chromosome segregation ATPase
MHQLTTAQDHNSSLQATLAQQTAQIQELQAKLEQEQTTAGEQLAQMHTQLASLQAELAQKHSEIDHWKNQHLQQQQAYTALTEELATVKANAQGEQQRFTARETALMAEVSQLRQQVATLYKQLDSASQQLTKLKTEGDRLKQDYDQVLRQLHEQRALAEIGSSSINRWRHRSIG